MLLTYSNTFGAPLYSACKPNPCQNGGTCADANDDGTPECTCVGGFSGDRCDIPTGNGTHRKLQNEPRIMED